jgi:hypothetical protein
MRVYLFGERFRCAIRARFCHPVNVDVPVNLSDLKDKKGSENTRNEFFDLIPKAAAFLHVINDHRRLGASGCAWNLVGLARRRSQERSP